jgi:lipopolysaccharide exporter
MRESVGSSWPLRAEGTVDSSSAPGVAAHPPESGLQRMARLARSLNPRNETAATVFCFAGGAAIKLVSSVVLTRLLYPEAYGIIGMLAAVMFIVEMMSDIGVVGLLIRHVRGNDPVFIHTLWTMRLIRNLINGSILLLAAPYIAGLYETPELQHALQIFSAYYLLKSIESMSFITLIRDQRSRVVSYFELLSAFLSMLFVLVFTYFRRDHYGMVLGMLLTQALTTVFSYCVRDALVPRIRFDREAIRELFGWAKYVAPSSYLCIGATQFDRMVFLKLFDLRQLGLYNLAGGLSGPVEGLVTKLSRFVLYPRFAEYVRGDPSNLRQRVYSENRKTVFAMIALPVLVGGSAEIIVRILFDPRYIEAGLIAQAFCVRALLLAFYAPSEDLLMARGDTRTVMIGNALRFAWIVPATLVGYQLFGFKGFLAAVALDVLPALAYVWWRRHRLALLQWRRELTLFGAAVGGFVAVAAASSGLIAIAAR